MNPYETVGVDQGAATAEIERAYRAKARRSHPDAGGSADEFKRLNTAVAILRDPKRRRRYDETGTTDEGPKHRVSDADAMILPLVTEAFSQDTISPVEFMRRKLDRRLSDVRQKVSTATRSAEELRKRIDKFRAANKGSEGSAGFVLIVERLEAWLADGESHIAMFRREEAATKEAIKLTNGLKYPGKRPFADLEAAWPGSVTFRFAVEN